MLKRNGNHDHLVVLAWFVSGHETIQSFVLLYIPTFSTVSTAGGSGGWGEKDLETGICQSQEKG
jgi:hypothetical protein